MKCYYCGIRPRLNHWTVYCISCWNAVHNDERIRRYANNG